MRMLFEGVILKPCVWGTVITFGRDLGKTLLQLNGLDSDLE